ncbi:MAG: methyltransferase domain-containing protein, partial [Candidatus Bathyarchaeia archaeon]
MVKVAASKTLSLGAKSSIELLLGDAENLPFRERVFTKAICNTVLEFTERPNKVVFELSRVIKEDGEAVIGVLTSTSIWAIRRRLQNLWTKNVYSNAQFYTLNKFRKLLKNSGLVYAGHRWAVFTPPRCPRILIPLLKRLEKPSINHLLSGIAAFLAVKVVHPMPLAMPET